jgi:hypothetical protein
LILVVVAAGVVVAWELPRKWFSRTSNVASLIAIEAAVVAIAAAVFLFTQSGGFRAFVFLVAAFFMLAVPLLWRDTRIANQGEPAVRTVFPTRVGKPVRIFWGIVAVVSTALYCASIASDPRSFSWDDLVGLALGVAVTAYIAVTSRVPAWTAKVFGADQKTSN